jgi:predicted nuclease of predicted toxin-antitoxin system
MIVWLDAQLSPAMAAWISGQFAVPAVAVRDLGAAWAKALAGPDIAGVAR